MTDPALPRDDRLHDLLADRALFGLEPEEEAELRGLLAGSPGVDPDGLDRLAAAIALSSLPLHPEPLPAGLRERIAGEVARQRPRDPVPAPGGQGGARATAGRVEPSLRRGWVAAAGWLAAAACLLLAVGLWWSGRPGGRFAGPSEERAALLAQAGRPGNDVIRLNWTATQDPAAAGAGGDVVWSTREQKGFLRFRGLPANEPGQSQYQLWIIDRDRATPGRENYPVDGGVFDIPPGGGDVVVPITARLPVGDPGLFAVTIERPGGVVVSTRERLPLLAEVPPRPAGQGRGQSGRNAMPPRASADRARGWAMAVKAVRLRAGHASLAFLSNVRGIAAAAG